VFFSGQLMKLANDQYDNTPLSQHD